MSTVPDGMAELVWGSARALPVGHVFELVLDRIESHGERPEDLDPAVPRPPVDAGVWKLNEVLGGGIARGTVAVVEADIEAHGKALLSTATRWAPDARLLDTPKPIDMAFSLLAADAHIPEIALTDGELSAAEWTKLAHALRHLSAKDIRISNTSSISSLTRVTEAAEVDLLIVHQPERFGDPLDFLQQLSELAWRCDVAVLTVAEPLDESRAWVWDLEHLTRVGMHGFGLGGSATLVRTDPDEMLSVAQVTVESLYGIVS